MIYSRLIERKGVHLSESKKKPSKKNRYSGGKGYFIYGIPKGHRRDGKG